MAARLNRRDSYAISRLVVLKESFMSTTRIRITSAVIAVCIFAAGIGVGMTAKHSTNAADAKDQKLKQLLTEKVRILQDVESLLEKLVSQGRTDLHRYCEAQAARCRAELELCETDKERMEVLEKSLAVAQKGQEYAKTLFESARGTQTQVREAEVNCLDIEIAMERIRIK
jgi:hypothetical protein